MPHALLQNTNSFKNYKTVSNQSKSFVTHNETFSLTKYGPPLHYPSIFNRIPFELQIMIVQHLDADSQLKCLSTNNQLWQKQIQFLPFSSERKKVERVYSKLKQQYGDDTLPPTAMYHCLGKQHHLSNPVQYAPVCQTKRLQLLATNMDQTETVALDATWLYAAATVGNTDLCLWLAHHENLGQYLFKAFETACTYNNTQTALALFEWLYTHTPKHTTAIFDYWNHSVKLAIQAKSELVVSALLNRLDAIVQTFQNKYQAAVISTSNLSKRFKAILSRNTSTLDDNLSRYTAYHITAATLRPDFDALVTLFLTARESGKETDYWVNLLSNFAAQMDKKEKFTLIDNILALAETKDSPWYCMGYELSSMVLELSNIEAFTGLNITEHPKIPFDMFDHQHQLLRMDLLNDNLEKVECSAQAYNIEWLMAEFDYYLQFKPKTPSIERSLHCLLTRITNEFAWITAYQTEIFILKASQAGYLTVVQYLIEKSGHIGHINLLPAIEQAIQRNDAKGVEIFTLLKAYVTHDKLNQLWDEAIIQDNWGVVQQLLTSSHSLESLMESALRHNKYQIVEGLRTHRLPNDIAQHFDWRYVLNDMIKHSAPTLEWTQKKTCHHFITWFKQGYIEQPTVILDTIIPHFEQSEHHHQHPWMSKLLLTLINGLQSNASQPNQTYIHCLETICKAIQKRGDISSLYNIVFNEPYLKIKPMLLSQLNNQTVAHNTLKAGCTQITPQPPTQYQVRFAEQLHQCIQRYDIQDSDILSTTLQLAVRLDRFDIVYAMINLKQQQDTVEQTDKSLIQNKFELSQSGRQWLNKVFPTDSLADDQHNMKRLSNPEAPFVVHNVDTLSADTFHRALTSSG